MSFSRLQNFSIELSHELRTPLNRMICQAEVCLSLEREREEYKETVASMLEECYRNNKIVDTILFLAKIDNNNYKICYRKFNAAKLLTSLLTYLQLFADEKNILLTVKGNAELEADETLIKQVFSNLIINSICYCNSGTEIKITIQQSKESMTIFKITDVGIGISETDLPYVFDRFYRGRKHTKHSEGVGIGLAVAKSIIKLHRGKIFISSTEGHGTTVLIELPNKQDGNK